MIKVSETTYTQVKSIARKRFQKTILIILFFLLLGVVLTLNYFQIKPSDFSLFRYTSKSSHSIVDVKKVFGAPKTEVTDTSQALNKFYSLQQINFVEKDNLESKSKKEYERIMDNYYTLSSFEQFLSNMSLQPQELAFIEYQHNGEIYTLFFNEDRYITTYPKITPRIEQYKKNFWEMFFDSYFPTFSVDDRINALSFRQKLINYFTK